MTGATAGEAALPEYRVEARNLSRESANAIHHDAVARAYGYAGGLVAGTTVYAYMTHPLVAAWGLDWLRGGTLRVRFRRPVYEGDVVRVRARIVGRSGGPVAGEAAVELEAVVAREGREEPVAAGVAGIAWGGPAIAPDVDTYPVAPLPVARPPATAEHLQAFALLGSPTLEPDAAEVERYGVAVADPLALYRGESAVVHPGLLLQQANRVLAENVALGPWIHVGSDVAHLGVARAGERLTTRGRVARLFEVKGRPHVELDLLVVAGDSRPIAHLRHTAIYHLAPAGRGA